MITINYNIKFFNIIPMLNGYLTLIRVAGDVYDFPNFGGIYSTLEFGTIANTIKQGRDFKSKG
jgi:hypothetical protein